MKANISNKLVAVVRIRGRAGTRYSINETLNRLNLKRVNNLTLLFGTKSNIGMIHKCNDFITYGEVTRETIEALLEKREIKVQASELDEIISGKRNARESMKLPIRMHPPKRGYEGIKQSFGNGGALGYRGESMDKLVRRMI